MVHLAAGLGPVVMWNLEDVRHALDEEFERLDAEDWRRELIRQQAVLDQRIDAARARLTAASDQRRRTRGPRDAWDL